MNFAESRFWLLLGESLGLILILRMCCKRFFSARALDLYDRISLAGIGLFLLASVSLTTFVIFLVVMLTTYFGLVVITKYPQWNRLCLWPLIILQLSPLIFYKYGYFLTHEIWHADFTIFRGLIIPVGISFYTFQKIALVVDTLHYHRPLPRFLDYLNFACFFPQIVAGPIERQDKLMPQMERFRFSYSAEKLDTGVSWIVVGLFFKCCLADNLALFFNAENTSNPFIIWFANLLFGLRIYYDFAGYSLIAYGLGKCFGIDLTLNFASPYTSCSPIEFWKRWHITLSQWFRDYLYIPMGGNRVRFWMLNVLIVFMVSGIWHGAGWNFLLWGLFHGLLVITARFWPDKGYRIPAWVCTTVLVFFSWVFFYESRTDVLLQKLQSLLSPSRYNAEALRATVDQIMSSSGFVLISLLLLVSLVALLEFLSLRQTKEPYSILRRPACLVILIFLTISLSPGVSNGFIYFAF